MSYGHVWDTISTLKLRFSGDAIEYKPDVGKRFGPSICRGLLQFAVASFLTKIR